MLFYAVSLAILEIAELATDADIGTRRHRELRIAGFGLFGIGLAKLFYDLTFLSSLTRALSFIAVGAVLLFACFFYQRLSEQLESRERAGRPA